MISGFLGKGGSGKSTLATLFTKYLAQQNTVLAIDADHNMDLTFNLGAPESIPHFGTTGTQFLLDSYADKSKKDMQIYSDLYMLDPLPSFNISPSPDIFTEKYAVSITPNISLMSTGPHNDIILHGNRCSHSLSTPLKVYLPLLKLEENEYVVVDMIASSDAAATGIPTGFTCAFVAVEPTPHSIKAASQIIDTLKFFTVPFAIVLNKSVNPSEDTKLILEKLGSTPIAVFTHSMGPIQFESISGEHLSQLQKMHEFMRTVKNEKGDSRKTRSIEKIFRNRQFKVDNAARL